MVECIDYIGYIFTQITAYIPVTLKEFLGLIYKIGGKNLGYDAFVAAFVKTRSSLVTSSLTTVSTP